MLSPVLAFIALTISLLSPLPAKALSEDFSLSLKEEPLSIPGDYLVPGDQLIGSATGYQGDYIGFGGIANFFFHPVLNVGFGNQSRLPDPRNALFKPGWNEWLPDLEPYLYTSSEVHGTTGDFDLRYLIYTQEDAGKMTWVLLGNGDIQERCDNNPPDDPCRDVSQRMTVTAFYYENFTVPGPDNKPIYLPQQTVFRNGREEVPAPLPLLGVGAALGYSRKIRKRIKANKCPEVVTAIG